MAGASRPVTARPPPGSAVTAAPCAVSSAARSAARGERTSTSRRPRDATNSSTGVSAMQPAAADDDQVVGGQRHLAHQVAGHEDRAALPGQRPEQLADPVDALGVQAVGGLVEHQHRRVTEQRRGDAEPLLHAEREPAGPPAGDRVQPGQGQHLGDPGRPDAVAARDRAQVLPGGPAGMHRVRVQHCAGLVQRADDPLVGAAPDKRPARSGGVQAQDDPQRGGLAGTVTHPVPPDQREPATAPP